MGAAQSLYLKAMGKRWRPRPVSQDEINRFYKIFYRIDEDNSNEVSLEEFYGFMKLERSPWMDRVFTIMDEDQSGEIDFREFVVCCWNYCSFDMLSLVTFAFNMFDLDGSGELERDEVQELVRDVYGSKYSENQHLHQVIKRLDRDGDGKVSYTEFVAFFRKYPVILFPAFTVQQTLRQRTFGERFVRVWQPRWSKLSKKRKQHIPDGKALMKMLKELDATEYKQHLREAMGGQGPGGSQGNGGSKDGMPPRGKSAKNLRRSGSVKGGSRLTKSKPKGGKDRGKGNGRGGGKGDSKSNGKGSSPNRRWATQARRLGKKGASGVPGPKSPVVAKSKDGAQSRGVGGDEDGEFAPPRNTLGAFATPSGIPTLNIAKVEQQRQRDEARRAARRAKEAGEKPPAKQSHSHSTSKGFLGSLLHGRQRSDKERAKHGAAKPPRRASKAALTRANSKARGPASKRAPLRRADSALPFGYLSQVKDQEDELFEAAKMDAMAASGSAFAASTTGGAEEEKGHANSAQNDEGLVVMESYERQKDTDQENTTTAAPAPARRDHQVVPAANKRRSSVNHGAAASRFVVGNE